MIARARRASSPFDHAHGTQARDLLREAGVVGHLDHFVDIFVGFGQLFEDAVAGFAADEDPAGFELALLFAGVLAFADGGAAHEAAGAVADAAEGLAHGAVAAREDPGRGAHAAGD